MGRALSRQRPGEPNPHSGPVKAPSGAFQEIYDAWAGEFAYDPGKIRAPVAIIRGEWDGMCHDADARWLFDRLSASPSRRDIKIGRATHLMHLEENRFGPRLVMKRGTGGSNPLPSSGESSANRT